MVLKSEFKVKGTKIPGLTARLIKHDDEVAIYKRSDGYYETGIVKRNTSDFTFPDGTKINKGEQYYWSNEDFGVYAKTTKDFARALAHFDYFVRVVHSQNK